MSVRLPSDAAAARFAPGTHLSTKRKSMNTRFFALMNLAAALILLTSCEAPAPNANQANRPANTVANSNANTAVSVNHEADVKKLMADLATVLQNNDADAAARYYSDDYHLVTPSGEVEDKAARIADMKSGATRFETFAYDDINVRSYGDIAVAVSRVKTKGKIRGQQQDREMRATLVLRKLPEGWKVVSGQATPITAAAPAKGLPTPSEPKPGLPTPQATPPANSNK